MTATRTFLRSPLMVVSALLVLALVTIAVIAPSSWSDAAETPMPADALQGASSAHRFGTDGLGRDILARVLVATRLSLTMALIGTAIGTVGGVLLGALPVAFGPRVQRAVSAVINAWLAFPVLLVAMLVVILLDAGVATAVVALGVTMTPQFARLTQTLSARVGGSEYLAAARLLGVSRGRQLMRYVIPNIAEPVIINVTLSLGGGLLALSSLSFLGVGVQPPNYDWGRLLADGFDQVYSNPMAAVGPGLFIVAAGLAFGMLGESIASHLRGSSGTATLWASPDLLEPLPSEPLLQAPLEGALLEVRGLRVAFPADGGWTEVVHGVDMVIMPGEMVGIVGESGSGKSVTMMAIAGLADSSASVRARRMLFRGVDVCSLSARERAHVMAGMGVVFQDSLSALNPAMRVGSQIAEVPRFQAGMGRAEASARAVSALNEVAIPDAKRRAGQFPHEFSGGMRQRALIAMAEVGDPELLIADEPTTALDVTVQRQVLTVLREQCEIRGQAVIVVSHDIAVLGELCQRLVVMRAGSIVDAFASADLQRPASLGHPYSRALVAAIPDLSTNIDEPLTTVESVMAEESLGGGTR